MRDLGLLLVFSRVTACND